MANLDLGLYFRATSAMYWDCMKEATALLQKNWPILIGSVLAYTFFLLSAGFFAPFGWGGGFVMGFIHIALVSLYFSWISESLRSEKLGFRELLQFDYSLFFTVISAAFVIFIGQYLFSIISQSSGNDWIMYLFQFGIVVVFNALPETIYIHRLENLQALGHAAEFTRENWIEWFVPYVVLLAPLLFLSPKLVLVLLSQSEELMPALTIFQGLSLVSGVLSSALGMAMLALALVLANWYMLFRGLLYKSLEGGTRRKRMFDARG